MAEYTNTSTDALGELDGYPIKPCMKSGFCCTTAPCGYGEWDPIASECKHLLSPNDIGQRDCGRYDWIKENVPMYEFYPGFGTGCCMPMFNKLRMQVIENIKNKVSPLDG